MTAKTYHARRWTGTRFTATACGAPSFVDYGTTQRDRVNCRACLALLEPVAALEPVAVAELGPVVGATQKPMQRKGSRNNSGDLGANGPSVGASLGPESKKPKPTMQESLF